MLQTLDFQILDGIQAVLKCPFMDTLMPLVTKLCDDGIFFILFTVLLLIDPKTRKIGIAAAFALILNHVATNIVIKNIVCRPRPCHLREVALLIEMPHGYSFPSGHTSTSFAVSTAVFLHRKKMAIPLFVLSALIAFSRLYLYVHFPSDILGGLVVGVLCGIAAAALAKRLPKRKKTP